MTAMTHKPQPTFLSLGKTWRVRVQRGFSLVTAIFLLVVLASLGAMMMTFFTAQQQSSALDVLGTRAYQASRAGIEWAAFGVSQMPPASATAAATLWPGCATGTNFPANTLGGTLAPFSVTVSCTATSAVEGTNPPPTIYIYDITSTATGPNGAAPGSADYVERVINVRMGR